MGSEGRDPAITVTSEVELKVAGRPLSSALRQALSFHEACVKPVAHDTVTHDTTGKSLSGAKSAPGLEAVLRHYLSGTAHLGESCAREGTTMAAAQLSPLMQSWHRTRPPSSQLRHLRKMTDDEKRCLCCADFLLPPQTGHGRYW